VRPGSCAGEQRRGARRVLPAIVASPAFLRLWRTALTTAHYQLLLILDGRSHLLSITGSALTINVTVAARALISTAALPRQLDHLLPTATPVTVTIPDNRGLGQARAAVRITDALSRILPPATAALALVGLAAARRRRRALLWFLIPVAALGLLSALAVHLLTRTSGSPPVTAAASALTTPLTSHLILTTAICGIASALMLAGSRLVPISQFAKRPERRTEP
jgi:hypothetical protein